MQMLNILNTILLTALTIWYINLSIEALLDKEVKVGKFYVNIFIYAPTIILIVASIANIINIRAIT